ncbi:MAG: endoglucanase A [Burkholderiales bacterium]|nr:endoglucanase A [Anaerolineae bacterium]
MTAYNWENNASNAGSDWCNQNDALMSASNVPGVALTPTITQTFSSNLAIVLTVPTIGYVAADKNHATGCEDVNVTPNYLSTRFKVSVPKKNAPFTLTPSATDGFVYQDEWVNFLDKTYPTAKTDATRTIFYSLDNEPDLWASTHRRLRGDATSTPSEPSRAVALTYAEIVQRSKDYAVAIKDVVPQALVFGPVNYGWQGMVNLQSAPDAAGRDFLSFYLQQMAAAQTSTGKRLLDVLDVHWYPEANAGGIRITESNAEPAVAAARMAAPRSLWDATYLENSWITQCCGWGPIQLLPRLKQKISANYPGTKIAITEYNYGGGNHISGGIAQADVLGIFGRDGVFAANLWPLGGSHAYIHGGFEMFRNFDGFNGSFGNTAIQAASTDMVNTSVYASVDAGNPNRVVVVAINKLGVANSAAIRVWHTTRLNKVKVYTLTSASSQPQVGGPITIRQLNAFQYIMPAHSVSTLVLEP